VGPAARGTVAIGADVDNPYLGLLDCFRQGMGFGEPDVYARTLRRDLTRRFSWAIPNADAVRALSAFVGARGIVEVGAGTGYWAWLLRQAGSDVLATDAAPPREVLDHNVWHPRARPWVSIAQGDAAEAAAAYPDRCLLLCWPPSTNDMAAHALAAYRGDAVAYVGEPPGGATATLPFHEALDAEWELADCIRIPRFERQDDALELYRRKRAAR
jgi:hypothetical protein